jgi:hypothetical protein
MITEENKDNEQDNNTLANEQDKKQDSKTDNQEEIIKLREEKAKLEGQLEAAKSFLSQKDTTPQQAQQSWTEEQWQEFTEKTGMTKEQLMVIDNIFKIKEQEWEKKLKETENKALEAHKKLEEFEKKSNYEKEIYNYFKSKPAFLRYEKDIQDFLNDYPEEVKKDPVKLKSLLAKAETYVKGKVGDKMTDKSYSSQKFNKGEEREEVDELEVDTSDMRDFERLTIERKVNKLKNENLKVLDDYKRYGNGIEISCKDDLKELQKGK